MRDVPAPAHRVVRLSKDDYLRCAATLAAKIANTSGAASPLSHVSIASVAELAGVSRSSLYRLWPSQKEFWEDLLSYIVATDPPAESITPSQEERPYRTEEAPQGVVFDAVQTMLLSERSALVKIGLVGHPTGDSARQLVARRRTERIARFAEQLAVELDSCRSGCIDGLDLTDIAVALTMIGNGIPITGRLTHAAYLCFDSGVYEPSVTAAGRSMFGTLQTAVWEALTTTETWGLRSSGPERTIPVIAPVPPSTPTGRRRDYLEIAAALALTPEPDSSGVAKALHYLSLDGLARELGVARRTLANVWPDYASFRLDLLGSLIRSERDSLIQCLQETERAVLDSKPDALGAFVDLGDRIQAMFDSRRHELSFLAFAPHLDDVTVTARARPAHDHALVLIRHVLCSLLQNLGYQPRPGVTPEHLAVALLVICDGANRLLRTNSRLVRRDVRCDQGLRSITGLTVASVLMALTEPVDNRPQVAGYLRLVS